MADQQVAGYQWGNNRYFGSGTFSYRGKQMNWDAWRASTGLEKTSRYQPGRPTGVWTFVRPNKYEPGRANIVIYNWDRSARVAVDVSNSIARGARYEVRDAQNFFGPPVASGTYTGAPLDIPMTGLTPGSPNGAVPTAPKHSAPEFGAFILLPARP
jgi:hypothetical protein